MTERLSERNVTMRRWWVALLCAVHLVRVPFVWGDDGDTASGVLGVLGSALEIAITETSGIGKWGVETQEALGMLARRDGVRQRTTMRGDEGEVRLPNRPPFS